MISAICAIKFINQNIALGSVGSFEVQGCCGGRLCVGDVPDVRYAEGFHNKDARRRSPMSPDTQHTHHYLLRFRFSHSKATMVILIADTVAIIFFGVLSYFVTSFYVVPLMLLTSLAVSLWLKRRERQIKHVHTAI